MHKSLYNDREEFLLKISKNLSKRLQQKYILDLICPIFTSIINQLHWSISIHNLENYNDLSCLGKKR